MPGVPHPVDRRAILALRLGAALLATLGCLAVGPGHASAAGPIIPDASCSTEATFKSLAGDTAASLQVINKSPEVVKVWWLDYSGKRVFYEQLPPFTMYVQRTFLTHPWVITNVAGQCYRFLVMTSQLQSVTVEGDPPDPDATVVPYSGPSTPPAPTPRLTPAPTVASAQPIASPVASSAEVATAGPAVPTGQTSDSSGTVAVVAVATVAVAAGAGLALTGRLPGFRRGRGG